MSSLPLQRAGSRQPTEELSIYPRPRSPALKRQISQSSQASGAVPFPRQANSPSSSFDIAPSTSSSRLIAEAPAHELARRDTSSKAKEKGAFLVNRRMSGKGKQKETEMQSGMHTNEDGWRSPISESGSTEIIETPSLIIERDPGTGRKMINQYLVLQEIGSGAHGTVRLGRDMLDDSLETSDSSGSRIGPYYAIKIVDRVPKKKRLGGLSRQKAAAIEGVNVLNETEIRKEIAIFKKINHPNVIRLKEIIDSPESSKIFMILEYCEGGEMQWTTGTGSPSLSLSDTRDILRQTLLGLEYLHHQGIIHRDIKPSNLLFSKDGTVKISDFGCSHYSEALQAASAQPGAESEQYVDDIELAKTAGSPAFFAPEMCYSGLDSDPMLYSPTLPMSSPPAELPGFTLRPPSVVSEFGDPRSNRANPLHVSPGGHTFPLKPTQSNDSASSQRPKPLRVQSHRSSTHRNRLPITNAIDVWALGVTLYCMLFGSPPFEAPNEYLLMQAIPTKAYPIPPYMTDDSLPTDDPSNVEVQEVLDLLKRLLEKDQVKRISLEHAKRHAFILHGLPDPATWLSSTDPHAQSFVTVSNAEVASVVVKSAGFRDKVRKGIKTISHRLHIFSTNSRSRSRSIGDSDSGQNSGASGPPSGISSQVNLRPLDRPRVALAGSTSREQLPITSTNTPRRFSVLGLRPEILPHKAEFVQLASPQLSSVDNGLPRTVELSTRSLSASHIEAASAIPGLLLGSSLGEQSNRPTAIIPLAPLDASPKTMASTLSLDKLRVGADLSPTSSLRRRQSTDIDVLGRQRSPSNVSSAASSGLGSRIKKIISRTGSYRSRLGKNTNKGATPEVYDSMTASPIHSPTMGSSSFIRDGPFTSQNPDASALRTYSPQPGGTSAERSDQWESRLRLNPPATRRSSNLSEEFVRGVREEELEWDGTSSDDDDYDIGLAPPTSRPSRGLELDVTSRAMPSPSPKATASGSASSAITASGSPTSPRLPIDLHRKASARGYGNQSPSSFRSGVPRARSPLGVGPDGRDRLDGGPRGGNLLPVDGEEDDVLAISVGGSRRGRKGSVLGQKSIAKE